MLANVINVALINVCVELTRECARARAESMIHLIMGEGVSTDI